MSSAPSSLGAFDRGERAQRLARIADFARGRRTTVAESAAADGTPRPRSDSARRAVQGSSSMRISRSTPPMRTTLPTPGTDSSLRDTVSSTNHDSASSSMRSDATENVRIGWPAVLTLPTIGSSRSLGRSERMFDTAARTSFSASNRFFSRWNMITVVDAAFGHRRRDVFDVADRRHGVFDLAGDFGFELRCRRALHHRGDRTRPENPCPAGR